MPNSGVRLFSLLPSAAYPVLLASLVVILSACSSDYQGKECNGEISTLYGQPVGVTKGMIIDRFNSFSVSLPDLSLDSGPLQSSDHQLYIPSATTRDGWLAQRVSDHRFTLVYAPKDRVMNFTCP